MLRVTVVPAKTRSAAEIENDDNYAYEVTSSEESRTTVSTVVRPYGEFVELRKSLPTLDATVKFPPKTNFPAVSVAFGLDDAVNNERAAALQAWLTEVVDACASREIDDAGVDAVRKFLGLDAFARTKSADNGSVVSRLASDIDTVEESSVAESTPDRGHHSAGPNLVDERKYNELKLKIIQREERCHQYEIENADLQERVRELAETRAELERARLAASRDRAKLLAKCEALEKERDSLSRQNEAISRRHQQLLLQIGGAQLDSNARDAAPNRPRPPPGGSPQRKAVCFGGC